MKRNTLLYVYLPSASTGNVRRDLQTYKDLNGGPKPTDKWRHMLRSRETSLPLGQRFPDHLR